MNLSVGFSRFTYSTFNDMKRLVQFLTFGVYIKHHRENTDPIFEINKTKVSCYWVDSTFVPF